MANFFLKGARTRNSTQLPLVVFGALSIALFLIGRTQPMLFDRARAQLFDWSAPAFAAMHAPLDGFHRWAGNLGSVFGVYRENIRLKDENARLRQWQGAAIQLQDRVERYERLLHAVPKRGTSFVLARVIGRSGRPFLETMILDAGKMDGIKPGEAVLDARGLLGRVYLASNHTSWVILLKDLSSRIPVVIEPGNVQAILSGDNSEAPLLSALPSRVNLKVGDAIITSGDGGLLPPGLAVGTVISHGGKFRAAVYADPGSSTDVEIINFKRPPEQVPAPSPLDIPVSDAPALAGAPRNVASVSPAAPVAKPVATAQKPKPVPVERENSQSDSQFE